MLRTFKKRSDFPCKTRDRAVRRSRSNSDRMLHGRSKLWTNQESKVRYTFLSCVHLLHAVPAIFHFGANFLCPFTRTPYFIFQTIIFLLFTVWFSISYTQTKPFLEYGLPIGWARDLIFKKAASDWSRPITIIWQIYLVWKILKSSLLGTLFRKGRPLEFNFFLTLSYTPRVCTDPNHFKAFYLPLAWSKKLLVFCPTVHFYVCHMLIF